MDGASFRPGCDCDDLALHHALLSHEDARNLALGLVRPMRDIETVPLHAALGRHCTTDIRAPHAMPAFDNSAMDGFALRLADLDGRCCLPVAGCVAAGDAPGTLPPDAAMRIYTGAPIPDGADCVVMVEACIDKGDRVHIDAAPTPGANIRRAGSDQSSGEVLIAAHTRIRPHHVGLLAANGLNAIAVTRRPRVAVYSTGDELSEGVCRPGHIPDANRPMLCALLAEAGAEVEDRGILPDDLDATAAAFAALDDRFDLIVTSGAVSMGGKDHVRAALRAAGGDLDGWRVALKPGKPVMFGRLGTAAFTGLPGNPFAVHVGFHLFVAAQLARLVGATPADFATDPAVAGFDWTRKPGRAEVFPVRRTGHDTAGRPVLERLGKSVSATLAPLAAADGLAMVPAATHHVAQGDTIHWQPFCTAGVAS
ncbi:molybdopterin molybdotransferase MoeA [Palleronia sediminis]|uniref:Molybdopterin molybdenumtransferase n=1 Tax=Palleronia sediminis TaxID=2547833 RepID=A0A4R6AAH8_9RHOB|nr:gephyrin-like molybdotransferase Glp [Palleronia sediminis]TDL78266.1 molybdopterin molybdotransferase MoeA [Palleronia sediminis]